MFVQSGQQPETGAGIRIVSIAGTRPEAIKFAPLIIEAARRRSISLELIATGQQDALFDDALKAFGLRADRQIDAGQFGGDREAARRTISNVLQTIRPDLVLVQGDTDSALIAAQAAHCLGIAIGHVEAGLRSFDPSNPFPEEQNRVAIARVATLHFAPSERAADNLRREAVDGFIHVTGNTGIDALVMQRPERRNDQTSGDILVTCHRRENFGEPIERICAALAGLARRGLKFTVPLHSNPKSAGPMRSFLSGIPGISLVPPLSYGDLVAAMATAPFVLSDSGGLQEECAALGVPLLLLRETTERPEVVESGNCRLVGSDPAIIVDQAFTLAHCPQTRKAMSVPSFPYGRGSAALKILDVVEAWKPSKWSETTPARSRLLLQ